MKYSKLILKVFVVFISFLAIGSIASGQTLDDFREAYNNGVNAQQANNLDEAIANFNKCIEIYSQLGTYDSLEAEDIIIMVESNMPALYYKVAMELYNEKNLDGAIEKFEETIEVADKYNDPGLSAKASKVVPQLYYMRAGNKYNGNDFEGALADYDKAISDLRESKLLSDNSVTRTLLAKAYLSAERYEDAITELNVTINTPGIHSEARLLLEHIYSQLDRKPALKKFYEETRTLF